MSEIPLLHLYIIIGVYGRELVSWLVWWSKWISMAGNLSFGAAEL